MNDVILTEREGVISNKIMDLRNTQELLLTRIKDIENELLVLSGELRCLDELKKQIKTKKTK